MSTSIVLKKTKKQLQERKREKYHVIGTKKERKQVLHKEMFAFQKKKT